VDHRLDNPLGVLISKVTDMRSHTIETIMSFVRDASERRGVEFDGWETEVVRQRRRSILSRILRAER
ncbi:MAG TPA: hypothetical protein VNT25_05850, partial [Allosphingosinicella sp.]|nr:hypothetical protein [Allosphingosinicella sp.]